MDGGAQHVSRQFTHDESKSLKKIGMATRTPETLAIKTCSDKANQPGDGKVNAEVFRQSVIETIHDNDNEQNPRDITQNKKPE
jgi:hypothetical protein